MTLRFPYWQGHSPHPIPSLGNQLIRPRPVVTVTLVGPTTSRPADALLDTGADDTVFRDRLATAIGLDLSNAPTRTLTGIGSAGQVVRYAQVHLRLTDGQEFREWPAWVGFTNTHLPFAVLGFAGLQFFTTCFHGDVEEVELTVNALYPGT